jgi:hypothetical protein
MGWVPAGGEESGGPELGEAALDAFGGVVVVLGHAVHDEGADDYPEEIVQHDRNHDSTDCAVHHVPIFYHFHHCSSKRASRHTLFFHKPIQFWF